MLKGLMRAGVVLFWWAALAPAHAQTAAPRLSALAKEPDWSDLDGFQGTMTKAEFTRLLETVYAPGGAWKKTISLEPEDASILTAGTNRFLLRFAPEGSDKTPPRYWRPLAKIPTAAKPLQGVKITLDPGHLGGPWAKMEERWFQLGAGTKPVAEGDMTLLTSHLLAARLQTLGAQVTFTHSQAGPETKLRPDDLKAEALTQLQQQKMAFIRQRYNGPADPLKMNSIQWASELLFYRTAEIQQRARLVNDRLKPDLALCLHYNAESWGDPAKPTLVEKNHLHVMVNGCYSAQELALDDVRHDLLVKLLSRCYGQELPIAEHVADSLAHATGLPPYKYTNGNAIRVGPDPYVWARNLLANRLYECPVVYIEPYVMNSRNVWERVQMGDYDGEKAVDGVMRKSIYREYADAVAEGIADSAREVRGKISH